MSGSNDKTTAKDKTFPGAYLFSAFQNNAFNMTCMATVFVVAVSVGYRRPDTAPKWILEAATESAAKSELTWSDNPLRGAGMYFLQTAFFLYAGFLFGAATAIPPVYMIMTSGLISGALSAAKGEGLLDAYFHNFPDALELIAMWIALSWGAKVGMAWFHKQRLIKVKEAFIEGNIVFLQVVVALLVAEFLLRIILDTGL